MKKIYTPENHYGLPSPSRIEQYLFEQEGNLITALRKKALLKSKAPGFNNLKEDAQWLAEFWGIYKFAPKEEKDKPSLPLAYHHFNTLDNFIRINIQKYQIPEFASKLEAELKRKVFDKPNQSDYNFFSQLGLSHVVRKRLVLELTSNTGWKVGSR